MQQRQDRYSEAMKPFGLERGLRNTGISHEGSRVLRQNGRISERRRFIRRFKGK